MDLFAERYEVREAAKRNLYTGKTYNSVENIQQFFAERGKPAPAAGRRPPARPRRRQPASATAASVPRPRRKKGFRAGATVRHPKYGRERCCAAKGMARMLSSR